MHESFCKIYSRFEIDTFHLKPRFAKEAMNDLGFVNTANKKKKGCI